MEISAAIANSGLCKLLLLPRLAHGGGGGGPIAAVRSDTRAPTCAPRALVRRTRRIRRKSLDAGDGDDLFYGDGDDGPFGGGGGGGSGAGGRGWGFGGDGGANWEGNADNSSSPGSDDPAFDFVYEVVLWIALSSCTHFAVKKLGRILEERGKVEPTMRLVPSMC